MLTALMPILLIALTVTWTTVTTSSVLGDGCDWTGSGLDYDESERGVQPVYLRCAQGKVEWKYPRGALRVILRHGTSGKDFKGCLKVHKGFYGARIYLEGNRELHALFSAVSDSDDRRHPQLPRCFTSKHGQVALYVEAENSINTIGQLGKKMVAVFSYDLQLTTRDNLINDPQDDCRPCSKFEMLRQFCTADFLVKGSISGIYHNEELSRTELNIRAKSVVRQNAAIFHKTENDDKLNNVMYGTVNVPLWCGVKQGGGNFMFMGRIMLEEPVISCAPRLEEWNSVREEAIRQGTNQCELS
ncbi:hypothetical protein CHUAL_002010 [Chamberlinius hualienensis]